MLIKIAYYYLTYSCVDNYKRAEYNVKNRHLFGGICHENIFQSYAMNIWLVTCCICLQLIILLKLYCIILKLGIANFFIKKINKDNWIFDTNIDQQNVLIDS